LDTTEEETVRDSTSTGLPVTESFFGTKRMNYFMTIMIMIPKATVQLVISLLDTLPSLPLLFLLCSSKAVG